MADRVVVPTATTSSGFIREHKDVTHKTRRMQSEVGKEMGNETTVVGDTVNTTLTPVPQSVTIENAIAYFEKNASGVNKNLFDRTAKWLKELMGYHNNKKNTAPVGDEEMAESGLAPAT